jgi:hypothetical protein
MFLLVRDVEIENEFIIYMNINIKHENNFEWRNGKKSLKGLNE